MKGLFPVLMLMVAAGQIQAAQQKTVTWSRQATGEQRLEVNVSYGAGELTLGRADSDLLYHARFDYDEDFKIESAGLLLPRQDTSLRWPLSSLIEALSGRRDLDVGNCGETFAPQLPTADRTCARWRRRWNW